VDTGIKTTGCEEKKKVNYVSMINNCNNVSDGLHTCKVIQQTVIVYKFAFEFTTSILNNFTR